MNANNKKILSLVIILIIFLVGCGTFEIGIESNTLPEAIPPTIEIPVDTATMPQPTEEPTAPPEQSDETAILAALADKLDIQMEDVPFAITENTGRHVKGNVSNGYFLAAKQDGMWVIIYDGQANPPCLDIDLNEFPLEMVPECLDDNNNLVIRSLDVASTEIDLLSLDCGLGSPGASPGTVESIACNIQDGLRSRNTSALLGYMVDPFIIGYWLSEGVMGSPEEMMRTIQGLYNYNDPNYVPRLSFTTNRDQFPELDGRPLEGRFGPDVNVVEVIYSQGWGEGDQEALIFISQDSDGDFKWHGMLTGDLDIPVLSP
jgi:hypothetical protein